MGEEGRSLKKLGSEERRKEIKGYPEKGVASRLTNLTTRGESKCIFHGGGREEQLRGLLYHSEGEKPSTFLREGKKEYLRGC